jgi:hypothetical protein
VQRDQLIQLLDVALAADANSTDRGAVTAAIGAMTRLTAWGDSQKIA